MTTKTIRALERGIAVLKALDENNALSLQQLHNRTGIAKATLLRILLTLEQEQMIRKSIGDGCYYPVPVVHGHKSASDRHALYASLAAPHLERLQQTVIWPSDFLIYNRYKMMSLETTRRTAALALNARYKIGFRVDMFLSAPGRAYLAFCSDAERERILAHYRKHPPRNALSASVLRNSIDDVLAATRAQGYAVRDPLFGGDEEDISDFDDQFDAIAVPLLQGGQIFGCINIVWVRKYNLRQKIIRECLAPLQSTAEAIAEALYHA
ncbi:MAG: IclR family transcriptional regulator [Rhodocyclaceae bacterium]|nr:MAG: IclR family transcriptional regulator [Rhodocyclaceae bacterium]